MFLKNIKELYHLADEELAKIMKCTAKRTEKLLNLDAEISTTEIVRICNYLKLWNNDELSNLFKQAVEDNDEYKQKHGKKIRKKLNVQ